MDNKLQINIDNKVLEDRAWVSIISKDTGLNKRIVGIGTAGDIRNEFRN